MIDSSEKPKVNFAFIKNLLPPIVLEKIRYIKAYLRFLPSKKFLKQNKKLKNIHKGQRCFILGSGKSLDHEEIKALKDEIVIGIHSFSEHPDFQHIFNSNTEKYFFKAPFHGPFTKDYWIKYFEELEKIIPKNTINFFGLDNYNPNIKNICEEKNLFSSHKIYWFFSNVVNNSDTYTDSYNDLDLESNIWTACTGSIGALIIALYMGFDEIYILGMDHDRFLHEVGEDRFEGMDMTNPIYAEEITHINEMKSRGIAEGKRSLVFQQTSEIFEQYERLNEMHPNRIFNLGKTSLVDAYESRRLVDVLDKK